MASKSNSNSRARSVLGGKGTKSKSKGGGGHPHKISIRHGKSGGHVVTHHYEPDESGAVIPDEEHVLPDKASLLQHISDNTPDVPAPPPTPPEASASIAPPPPTGM